MLGAQIVRTRRQTCRAGGEAPRLILTRSRPAAPLNVCASITQVGQGVPDGQSASGRLGNAPVRHRHRQISKDRQTVIGSAFVLRPRYLAVLSILAWPKSTRTVCKSPVPFKMWRAFVRRNDSTL